jgi:hypothetical protein
MTMTIHEILGVRGDGERHLRYGGQLLGVPLFWLGFFPFSLTSAGH